MLIFEDLYNAFLEASNKVNDPNYMFNPNLSRKIIVSLFSDFEIIGYYTIRKINDTHFSLINYTEKGLEDFIFNTYKYFLTEFKQQYPHLVHYEYLYLLKNYSCTKCHCKTRIIHCYILRNKLNGKIVQPVGNLCVLIF